MTPIRPAPSGTTECRAASLFASLLLGALGASACGERNPGQPASQKRFDATAAAITVALNEENRSRHMGKAVLRPGESGSSGPGGGSADALRVTVTLTTDTGERNHAHVHDVTCAEYRDMGSYSERFGTVVDTLRDLNGGQSETVLRGVSLADRTTGRFSINVHEQAHPYDVIACGDIPQR